MARHITAGIDIGAHTIRAIIAEADKDNLRHSMRVIGTGSVSSRGLRHGYIVNSDDAVHGIREAISIAEKHAKAKMKRAIVSIGGIGLESEIGNGFVMISRIDEEISENDVEKVTALCEENLKLRNRKILHRLPLGFKIDGKEVLGRPQGMHGRKLDARVLFVTCLDQHLDDFIGSVENAGVEVEDVVASPLAASLVTLSKPQRTAGCILTNIGAETVSIAVFEDDKLLSLKVFQIGASHITNDIALGLKIPLEEAEGIKIKSIMDSRHPQKKLDDIINARLHDIFDLIQGHLKKLGKNELLPAGIIITGGGAGISAVEETAKISLRLPARVVIPRLLGGDEDTLALDHSWSVAYGLCVLGFDNSYASDLFQINQIRIKNHLRGIAGWMRQFLP